MAFHRRIVSRRLLGLGRHGLGHGLRGIHGSHGRRSRFFLAAQVALAEPVQVSEANVAVPVIVEAGVVCGIRRGGQVDGTERKEVGEVDVPVLVGVPEHHRDRLRHTHADLVVPPEPVQVRETDVPVAVIVEAPFVGRVRVLRTECGPHRVQVREIDILVAWSPRSHKQWLLHGISHGQATKERIRLTYIADAKLPLDMTLEARDFAPSSWWPLVSAIRSRARALNPGMTFSLAEDLAELPEVTTADLAGFEHPARAGGA